LSSRQLRGFPSIVISQRAPVSFFMVMGSMSRWRRGPSFEVLLRTLPHLLRWRGHSCAIVLQGNSALNVSAGSGLFWRTAVSAPAQRQRPRM
jgi:hypothetical protein